MALDPFISVSDLEALLGESIVDPNALEVKIALDSACSSVRSYIGQSVNYVSGDVEIHSGSGRRRLRLRQRPVRGVASVELDDTVLEPESYSVRGAIITLTDGSVWSRGYDNVEVTYSHGWDISEATDDPVPADLRFVALNVARRVYVDIGSDSAATGAIVSETIGDYAYELSSDPGAAATVASQLLEGERMALDLFRIELVGDTPTM